MDRTDEVAALQRELAALRRTVAELVKLLHESGAFSNVNRRDVERRLGAAGRLAREEEQEDDDVEEGAKALTVATAYRGATPGSGGAGCAICGRLLGEDDPDLSVPKRGRVCVGCFERARAE